MAGGTLCIYCGKTDRELHEKGKEHHKNENGKTIIGHDCQVECKLGIASDCSKTFQLSQTYADWITEHKKGEFIHAECPKCEMWGVANDMKHLDCYKPEKQEEIKKRYKALKKVITGKDEPDDNDRERERETNPTITNWNSTIGVNC